MSARQDGWSEDEHGQRADGPGPRPEGQAEVEAAGSPENPAASQGELRGGEEGLEPSERGDSPHSAAVPDEPQPEGRRSGEPAGAEAEPSDGAWPDGARPGADGPEGEPPGAGGPHGESPGGDDRHGEAADPHRPEGDPVPGRPSWSRPSDDPAPAAGGPASRRPRPSEEARPFGDEPRDAGASAAMSGPNGAAGGDLPSSAGGAGAEGPTDPDAAFEPDALRRALRESVGGLEPHPEALPYLRGAIPARRARRRQALVGAAAAVVLVGVGASALVGGGLLPGGGKDSDSGGVAGEYPGSSPSGDDQSGSSDGSATDGTDGGGQSEGQDAGQGGQDADSPPPSEGRDSGGANSDQPRHADAPVCGAGELGSGSGESGPPDGQGRVYGSFRVANVSSESCVVESAGDVRVTTQGRAQGSRINVMNHQGGGQAPGLPGPADSVDRLLLEPGASYVVKFAWVPEPNDGARCGGNDSGAQTDEGAADGGGQDDPGGDQPGMDGGTDADGGANGGQPDDGGPGGEPGSVVVSHTPAGAGTAMVNATVSDACSGTVYRTGVLPS